MACDNREVSRENFEKQPHLHMSQAGLPASRKGHWIFHQLGGIIRSSESSWNQTLLPFFGICYLPIDWSAFIVSSHHLIIPLRKCLPKFKVANHRDRLRSFLVFSSVFKNHSIFRYSPDTFDFFFFSLQFLP
jgi:hypothetical protein